MKITDEVLSSFVDGELSVEEMERVRNALATDEPLAARIATLSQVDAEVKKHSSGIDRLDLPKGLVEKLSGTSGSGWEAETVLSFPRWRRVQHWVQQHQGLAASLVVAIAATFLLVSRQEPDEGLSALQQALNSSRSGEDVAITQDRQLHSRFSFINNEGSYCRQFRLSVPGSVTENIACKRNGDWDTVASITADGQELDGNGYQPATAMNFLDDVLDQMMVGGPITAADEQSLIEKKWQ